MPRPSVPETDAANCSGERCSSRQFGINHDGMKGPDFPELAERLPDAHVCRR